MSRADDLRNALAGKRGDLDSYLEVVSEDELRADILALVGQNERRQFAALAMQGLLANQQLINASAATNESFRESIALYAIWLADSLISELEKPR